MLPWSRGTFLHWGLACCEDGSYTLAFILDDATQQVVGIDPAANICFAANPPGAPP